MKLTMLGTGNALVTECYNTCFVLSDGKDHFMVDGGGGMTVLHQLKYAGLDWRQMRTIFVTHKHIDHLLGIIWMMRMICQHMREGTYEGEATIYAHDEVIALLRDLAGKLLQKRSCRSWTAACTSLWWPTGKRRPSWAGRPRFLISAPPRPSSMVSAWSWAAAKS